MNAPTRKSKPVIKPVQASLFEAEKLIVSDEWNPTPKPFRENPLCVAPAILKDIPEGYIVLQVAKNFPSELHCALYVENHMSKKCVLFDVFANKQDGGFGFRVLMPEPKGKQ